MNLYLHTAHWNGSHPPICKNRSAAAGCIVHNSVSIPPCPAGDYDTYVRTRAELEENQMKKYKWEQEQVWLTSWVVC